MQTESTSAKRRRAAGGASSAARVADLGTRARGEAPLEQACDRLCRLAARLLDVPAVLVTLRDEDRPFLVGVHGLAEAQRRWGVTPLSISLREHSGVAGEPLALADVRQHELLAEDPLHTEEGFRAFLALPLQVGGESLGTVCALSRDPREWTDDDVDALGEVAASVITEIRLRGSLRQIRAAELAGSERERQSFLALVDALDVIVKERDLASGRFTFVSRKAEDLLGYPVQRFLSEPGFWNDVVLDEDRSRLQGALETALDEGGLLDVEYRVRAADGRTVWIRDLARPLPARDGGYRLRGVLVDVTPQRDTLDRLQRSVATLRLVEELALLAHEATSYQEPFEHTVRRLALHTGWPVAHVYFAAESDPSELLPTSIWFLSDPAVHQPFQAATESARFRSGEGLPGSVLQAGGAVWMTRLADEPAFTRKDAAREAGLVSGFAFPVLAGKEVAAVLELFTTTETPPDAEMLELADHVSLLLGRVVERQRAELALRVSERRTRKIVENAHEAFISIDAGGSIEEWNPEAERIFGWKREEVVGRELAAVLLPERYREAHRRGLAHFRETGEGPILGRRLELEALTRSGGELPVELTISAARTQGAWSFNAFLRDISERRRLERESRRRERQLSYAQRLARLGSWEWDVTRDEITWSEELHRIFGTDRQTVQPNFEAYLALLPESDRDLAETVVRHALETGEDFAFEHRVVRPDGQVRTVLGQGSVEKDREGRVLRLRGTAQDITDRKELEEKNRQLAAEQAARGEAEAGEERVRGILESLGDAFFHLDGEGRVVFANSQGERLLGRPGAELEGEHLWDLLADSPDSSLRQRLEGASARSERVECEHYDPDRGAWFEVRAFPGAQGLSVYMQDISARKDAEARLRASESRYRFLSDAIPQHVWTALPDGRLEYVNRVVVDFIGLDLDEMAGRTWDEWVHPDERAEVRRRWQASVASGEAFEIEARLRGSRGDFRWHLMRAKAQRHRPDGHILRWYGTNTNVHDLKELEEARDRALADLERVTHLLSSERTTLEEQTRELRRAAIALQKSNQELDQFAYVASHDLKAPLRGIANLAQWLGEDLGGRLDDQNAEYLDLMQRRVLRMEGLIDGILQYSRAGRRRHDPETVDVGKLLEEVVDLLAPPERLTVEVQGYMPTVVSERAPLQQVFLNLIGNAIKHAEALEPRVTVSVTDEGGGWYEFSVSDNGPGIAPEYHERIFSIFQTLKPKDEVESTGIGLAVVKRIVERQGGHVWVESDGQRGATFRFLWPERPKDAKEGGAWSIGL